jgi:hypothetical protein
MDRPLPEEFASYYAAYIGKVPGNNVIDALRQQKARFLGLVKAIPEEKGDFAYAPGKWTIKELIGHVLDTERIFAYRALRISRGDKVNLPGFEQDDYVPAGRFAKRSLGSLVAEYESVRNASLSLAESFDSQAWLELGSASNSPFSVRALVYIIAGHELHHLKVLQEKYLYT